MMKFISRVTVAVVAGFIVWLFTIGPWGPDNPQPGINTQNVAGNWWSRYGCLTLYQDGSSVSGQIRYADGTTGNISGTINAGTLNFQYGHSEDSGDGTLVFAPNGSQANGHWRSNRWNKHESWLLERTGSC